MGMSFNTHGSDLVVRAERFPAAVAALKKIEGAYVDPDSFDDGDLFAALIAFDWEGGGNEAGDLECAWFQGDRWQEVYEEVFEALAPFVEPGGWINVEIDGEHSRWWFDGQKLIELAGSIVYEEPPATVPASDATTA
jgi:hypothetical protein